MKNEWRETTLGEVVNFRRGHDLPKTKMMEGAIPVVGSNGIIGYHDKHTTDAPCVSIGRSGNVGNPHIVMEKCWAHNTTLYIDDFKGNDEVFVYYFLQTLNLHNFRGGSAVPTLNRNHIHPMDVRIPPLPEQKAIAHILGSLDDKIELNRKMNETLEAMAQAMFKSWFVDFDPVIDNALAAGNTIPDELAERAEQRKALGDKRKKLPPEIQKLFPSEFIFTDKMGWIPKGWEAKTVGDLVDTVSKTYPLKSVSKVIFLNTGDIKEGKFLHNSKSDASSLPGQAKKSIQKSDILYSEIRPQNKRFAFVHFDSSEYVVSTKLMVLRSKGEVDSLFTYFILKQQDKIDYLQMMAESRSGTFPQITFDVLSKIQIVMPEASILNDFVELLLRPIFEKSLSKDKENETLSKLRDTLLPKLLSGELRIKDAEKLVEEIS